MCLTGIIVSTLRSLSVPPCQTRRLWNQSEGASTKQTRLGWQPQPITHLRRVCSMFAPPHHVSTCLHCVSCALLEGTALPKTHVMEPLGICEHQINTSWMAPTSHYQPYTYCFDVRPFTQYDSIYSLFPLCVPGV